MIASVAGHGRNLCLLIAAALALTVVACKSPSATSSPGDDVQQLAPRSDALPQLTLRDDTEDLLLTWIDENGDFKVVQKIEEVPEGARERVRVVVTSQEAGTGRQIYVADLRQPQADGTYEVSSLPRSAWDQIGAERRKVRMEAFAPAAPSSGASQLGADGAGANPKKVRAVIYGADWCKPCHDAEKLLKKLGADVTKKNIEKSRSAKAEMQLKLRKAGRAGASIPVIDVEGKLFVGYSPAALKQTVAALRAPETL